MLCFACRGDSSPLCSCTFSMTMHVLHRGRDYGWGTDPNQPIPVGGSVHGGTVRSRRFYVVNEMAKDNYSVHYWLLTLWLPLPF